MLEMITINGRLSFMQDDNIPMDIHLHATHIFVRAGEFLIGSEEKPFENKAQITLYGDASQETIVMDGAIEAGNKVMANVGLIAFYGLPRDRLARLIAPIS